MIATLVEAMDANLLDSLLDLEEDFYQEGYSLGVSDGAASGYTEGSVFAVEKGYEKFVEMGRLYGKALVWAQRLADSKASSSSSGHEASDMSDGTVSLDPSICNSMPALPAHSARLARNLTTLMELVDPASMNMSNTEDAVNDIDERLKGAVVKAKLVQRAMGEAEDSFGPNADAKDMSRTGDGTGSIEDISALNVRH